MDQTICVYKLTLVTKQQVIYTPQRILNSIGICPGCPWFRKICNYISSLSLGSRFQLHVLSCTPGYERGLYLKASGTLVLQVNCWVKMSYLDKGRSGKEEQEGE